jgi:hypothetical protein
MEQTWNPKIEKVLDNIRLNSLILSNKYKARYFSLSNSIKYYRLPIIVLSGANSIISVGLQNYVAQEILSLITSLISLLCSVIGSIELFLKINARMESDLISQRDFYLLSIEIFKTLSLARENRPVPAKENLEHCYNNYCKLIESSNPLYLSITDKLLPLELDEFLTLDNTRHLITHSAE